MTRRRYSVISITVLIAGLFALGSVSPPGSIAGERTTATLASVRGLDAPRAGGWPSLETPDHRGGDLDGDGNTDTTDVRLLAERPGVAIADVAALAKKIVYSDAPFTLKEASILDMQRALDSGVLTSVQLTQLYLQRIAAVDPTLNSLITVNPDAIALAAASDARREATGSLGLLEGIPVIVKDNFDSAGLPTTAGCTCLRGNVATKDSTIVAKLKDRGAIILAKANMSEFAINTNTYSSVGGQTHNPYSLSQTPGGSSGGTGAAVAADLGAFGLGTDTGGSIRIPASYNNIVGIRPTLGLASRDGIIPLALSQDTGGPMARTVTDAALALDAIVGADAADPATAASASHIPASYAGSLDPRALVGARIGLLVEGESSDPAVARLTANAVAAMESAGATVVRVSLSAYDRLVDFHGAATNEFKRELDAYLAQRAVDGRLTYSSLDQIVAAGDHGPGLGLGTLAAVTAEQSAAGMQAHAIDQQTERDALTGVMARNGVTALVYPSTASTASGPAGRNNRLSALSGFPAISVPMGFATATDGPAARVGTPANIELLGAAWSEPMLIGYAYAYERASGARRAPDAFGALR